MTMPNMCCACVAIAGRSYAHITALYGSREGLNVRTSIEGPYSELVIAAHCFGGQEA